MTARDTYPIARCLGCGDDRELKDGGRYECAHCDRSCSRMNCPRCRYMHLFQGSGPGSEKR